MAPPTYNWNELTTGQTDVNSPVTEDLMEGYRQNLVHLEEWLGDSYTAAKDHDHDDNNSAFLAANAIGKTQLQDNSVSLVELDITTMLNSSVAFNPTHEILVETGDISRIYIANCRLNTAGDPQLSNCFYQMGAVDEDNETPFHELRVEGSNTGVGGATLFYRVIKINES